MALANDLPFTFKPDWRVVQKLNEAHIAFDFDERTNRYRYANTQDTIEWNYDGMPLTRRAFMLNADWRVRRSTMTTEQRRAHSRVARHITVTVAYWRQLKQYEKNKDYRHYIDEIKNSLFNYLILFNDKERVRALAARIGIPIQECYHCHEIAHPYNDILRDGRLLCQTCRVDHFFFCATCGDFIMNEHAIRLDQFPGELFHEAHPINVRHCVYCNVDYIEGRANHRHPNGSGADHECATPHPEFAFTLNGIEITNDEVFTVQVPHAANRDADIEDVARFIYDKARRNEYDDNCHYHSSNIYHAILGAQREWLLASGTFPKRVSKNIKEYYGFNVPAKLLEDLGNKIRPILDPTMAAAGEQRIDELQMTLTRVTENTDRAMFGNASSCWWGGYGRSKCTLRQIGGMALRHWRTDSRRDHPSHVRGRAWFVPILRNEDIAEWVPCDPQDATGFLAFNFYGSFANRQTMAGRDMIESLTALKGQKVSQRCNEMEFNSGSTYLFLPEGARWKDPDGYFRFLTNWEHPR